MHVNWGAGLQVLDVAGADPAAVTSARRWAEAGWRRSPRPIGSTP